MDPAGPESIVFVNIFPQFLPNKDGSGILDLGHYFCHVHRLELHSPLTNLSGSITEARRARLELEYSTLFRKHKPNTEHLTHTLSLLCLVYNPQCIQAVSSVKLTFVPCRHILK